MPFQVLQWTTARTFVQTNKSKRMLTLEQQQQNRSQHERRFSGDRMDVDGKIMAASKQPPPPEKSSRRSVETVGTQPDNSSSFQFSGLTLTLPLTWLHITWCTAFGTLHPFWCHGPQAERIQWATTSLLCVTRHRGMNSVHASSVFMSTFAADVLACNLVQHIW